VSYLVKLLAAGLQQGLGYVLARRPAIGPAIKRMVSEIKSIKNIIKAKVKKIK
jgi:hypothetical protein